MNLLVGVRELGQLLGQTLTEAAEAQIARAQTLIQAEILGELEERVITGERYKPLYDVGREYGLTLRSGPVASLQALTVDTVEVDPDELVVGCWTIKRPEKGFRKGSVILVDYTVGYTRHAESSAGIIPNGGTVPEEIRQAILGVALEIYKRPDAAVQSEKIGDYTYTLWSSSGTAGEIPALSSQARLLVRKFKRPFI